MNQEEIIHKKVDDNRLAHFATDDIALKNLPSKFPFLRNFRMFVKAFENDSPDEVLPACLGPILRQEYHQFHISFKK